MTTIDISEDLTVRRDGRAVALPKSRKARALLAYLALERKPVHRTRLCEMFWDRAADPRGGLRWALTRLRRVLGPDETWLRTDRASVALHLPPDALTIDASAGGTLLGGTESGAHDSYEAWLVALRDRLDGAEQAATPAVPAEARPQQTIRYTHAPDGTRVAFAAMGEGRPVLKAANWLTHLDAELEIPVWAGFTLGLARRYRLYRYDERGSGLSDWNVADLSFDAFVSDLECVADALGLERFPLIGVSQGGAVSIEYAARHPHRVTGLVLIGAYPTGWRFHADPAMVALREAEMTLARHGWGDNSPAYRQIFSHSFLPGATADQLERFNEFQRQTTSAGNAARFIDTFGDIDVRHRLPAIAVPALVLHSRDDQRVAASVGAALAAALPDAELQTLPSNRHIPMEDEEAFPVMMEAIERFIETLPE